MTQEKKNFVWNLLGLTFNSFNSLFFLIIVKRINGLEVAGSFSFAYAIACLLYMLAVYYSRAYQVSNEEYTTGDFIFSRYISCIVMFFVSLIFCLLGKSFLDKVLIVLLCLFRNIEAIADVFFGEFQRKNRLDYVGKSMFFKAILGIIIFFIIDYYMQSILFAVLGLLFINLFGCVVDFFYLRKEQIKITIEKERIINLFKNSKSIFAFSFISIFLVNIQKYLIPFFEGESAEAIFSIIIMPGTMMSLCGQYLINPYTIYFTKMEKEKKYDKILKKLNQLILAMIIFSLIVSLALVLFGIPILNIIYDMDTKIYQNLFIMVILGAGLYATSNLISAILTIMKENSIQLVIYFISMLVSLVLSFIFIKNYAINGAVLSYTLTMIIHLSMYMYVFLKKEKKLMSKYNNK